jgi:hypothetical protein
MQHVTCDFFSNSFNSHLQILKSVRVGAVKTIFNVAPKETNSSPVNVVARTAHNQSVLESVDSARHGYHLVGKLLCLHALLLE